MLVLEGFGKTKVWHLLTSKDNMSIVADFLITDYDFAKTEASSQSPLCLCTLQRCPCSCFAASWFVLERTQLCWVILLEHQDKKKTDSYPDHFTPNDGDDRCIDCTKMLMILFRVTICPLFPWTHLLFGFRKIRFLFSIVDGNQHFFENQNMVNLFYSETVKLGQLSQVI